MSHWQRYHTRWSLIQPPLRPDPDVINAVKTYAGQGQTLLLGVTPELADPFDHLDAVDRNPAMIKNVWPGDTMRKRAIEGNWLEIELPPCAYAAVIGDGSLNNLAWRSEIARMLERAMQWLRPGGRFACRLFERPAAGFSRRQLQRGASETAGINFHAFKWQVAMHLAQERGANVPVASILQSFNELFPDRDELSRTTGWPRQVIDTIDVYQGSHISYSFPDRREFIEALPQDAIDVTFTPCGSYDLAACCPILTFQKPD